MGNLATSVSLKPSFFRASLIVVQRTQLIDRRLLQLSRRCLCRTVQAQDCLVLDHLEIVELVEERLSHTLTHFSHHLQMLYYVLLERYLLSRPRPTNLCLDIMPVNYCNFVLQNLIPLGCSFVQESCEGVPSCLE